jgi:acetolactate synthase-1/2/3 large subunit
MINKRPVAHAPAPFDQAHRAPTNAEVIAGALLEDGVQDVFGLPGGEVVALIDACRRAGIRFYLVGHEASAAFMADVTGQITGRAGVCMATLGPGAVNLCLGVANAFLDRSPVLALTASLPGSLEPYFPHQRLPLRSVFAGISKLSAVIDGGDPADVVRSCLRLAATPPCGPVHLALPSDLALAPAGPSRAQPAASPLPADRGAPLEELAAALRQSERPLLVAGVGCLPRDAPALRRFVDACEMPFVVTPKAKGALPEDAPGFLGVVGGMAIDRSLLETLDRADLLVGVGFDPVECDKDWYVSRPVLNLSRATTAEGQYAPLERLGEIAENLEALIPMVGRHPWPPEELEASRARLHVEPIRGDGLSPLEAIRALREILPRETVLTCDVGSHKYYAGQFWRSYVPHTFFMSNGLSAMGYGLPAAIAARLQFPDPPVVALVGDGGMLMMLHNLAFIRQYRVPVIVVVFVDESLSMIRIGQQRRAIEPYGVDFPAPDFARLAEGFGIGGVRVTSLDALKRAVEHAARARTAVVIHVPVNIREYEAYV